VFSTLTKYDADAIRPVADKDAFVFWSNTSKRRGPLLQFETSDGISINKHGAPKWVNALSLDVDVCAPHDPNALSLVYYLSIDQDSLLHVRSVERIEVFVPCRFASVDFCLS
jgi:hypothetical protein